MQDEAVRRWKARAVVGSTDPTQLVLARKVGESFTVSMNGTTCEVTVAHIGMNSVALLIETPERNLILRKELEKSASTGILTFHQRGNMANEVVELAKKFFEIRTRHEEATKVLKEVAEEWDTAEKELTDAMIEAGVNSVSVDGIGQFQLRRSSFPSVNAENKPRFFEYLKASGHGDLLRLDVPSNTLTAFLKRHVDELKQQLTTEGLKAYQAVMLREYRDAEGNLPYGDAAKMLGRPIDEMDSEEVAQAILKSQGAAMFTKTNIAVKK